MSRLNIQRPSTLHLSYPFGQTFVLALGILILMVGGLEAVSRLDAVAAHLPVPSVGSSRPGFEASVDFLDVAYDRHGPIDCIFMGSSLVQRSINPEMFQSAYQDQTGQEIRCFNFALSGFVPSDTSDFAEFLIRRYHPRLLVYGLAARDFSPRIEQRRNSDPVDLAWMKYERGEFSTEGWLIEHFQSYRYYLMVDDWMSPKFTTQFKQRSRDEQLATTSDGFQPRTEVFEVPADVQTIRATTGLGSKLSARTVDRVESFIRLQPQFPGTALEVVEVPVHPILFTYLIDQDRYHTLMTSLEDIARSQGVFFLSSTSLPPLPPEAWGDEIHMNSTGAEIYSTWLGEQLGIAVHQGRLSFFSQ